MGADETVAGYDSLHSDIILNLNWLKRNALYRKNEYCMSKYFCFTVSSISYYG